jgi:hypothetical protein
MRKTVYVFLILSFLFLSAYRFPQIAPSQGDGVYGQQSETQTPEPTPEAYGPDDLPKGVNPLTGLPASNPEDLQYPPAMLSITNWPITARPQAGLDYSSLVYEIYIGDGESRFLTIFYGDYPPEEAQAEEGDSTVIEDTHVGPLRSARLPYGSLRKLYNGFLVMASGFRGVLNNLDSYNNFFGLDSSNINSAMVDVRALKTIASAYDQKITPGMLNSNAFDSVPPAGGKPASDFWFIYNALDQIHWEYDTSEQAYYRYQDQADGQTFVQATDRLNGNALTFENVVLLFASHRYCTPYAFDIDLSYVKRAPALLFRDGQAYPIYWTTSNTQYELTTGKLRPIRFVDANGDPFPMKPGQTWIHVVPTGTPYWEAVQSDVLFDLLNKKEIGSGNWVSRFYASLMVYDDAVCTMLGR